MAWVSLSATQGERPAASAKARRSYQHQMFDHGSAGAIALGVRHGQAPAVVYDKMQDRRLGRGDAPRSFSHYRSAAGNSSPHSRRPVLETLPGIGLHFPAERIRAARGGLYSVRVLGSTPSRAQSLADQHLHKLAVAKINHLSNLSLWLTDLAASCATKGLGNVRKAFGEIRNV